MFVFCTTTFGSLTSYSITALPSEFKAINRDSTTKFSWLEKGDDTAACEYQIRPVVSVAETDAMFEVTKIVKAKEMSAKCS